MSADKCKHGVELSTICKDCDDDGTAEGKHSLAAPACSTPVNHLALAQKSFAGWLRELDGKLHDSELAYDEYAGNILSGDMEAASKSMYRATQSLRLGRLMIKTGLDAGV